jgi:hypothetical protein
VRYVEKICAHLPGQNRPWLWLTARLYTRHKQHREQDTCVIRGGDTRLKAEEVVGWSCRRSCKSSSSDASFLALRVLQVCLLSKCYPVVGVDVRVSADKRDLLGRLYEDFEFFGGAEVRIEGSDSDVNMAASVRALDGVPSLEDARKRMYNSGRLPDTGAEPGELSIALTDDPTVVRVSWATMDQVILLRNSFRVHLIFVVNERWSSRLEWSWKHRARLQVVSLPPRQQLTLCPSAGGPNSTDLFTRLWLLDWTRPNASLTVWGPTALQETQQAVKEPFPRGTRSQLHHQSEPRRPWPFWATRER